MVGDWHHLCVLWTRHFLGLDPATGPRIRQIPHCVTPRRSDVTCFDCLVALDKLEEHGVKVSGTARWFLRTSTGTLCRFPPSARMVHVKTVQRVKYRASQLFRQKLWSVTSLRYHAERLRKEHES